MVKFIWTGQNYWMSIICSWCTPLNNVQKMPEPETKDFFYLKIKAESEKLFIFANFSIKIMKRKTFKV